METGRRNNLTKKLNDFNQVLFETAMPTRAASLVAAMIRGTEPRRAAGFAGGILLSLQAGSSRRKI